MLMLALTGGDGASISPSAVCGALDMLGSTSLTFRIRNCKSANSCYQNLDRKSSMRPIRSSTGTSVKTTWVIHVGLVQELTAGSRGVADAQDVLGQGCERSSL